MKTYLITGGAGFIGSSLIDKLIGTSKIICVDNFSDYYDPQIKRKNIAAHLNNDNFRLYDIDIADSELLKQVFDENKIDCIINLAAQAGVRASAAQWKLYTQTNINGTINLLEMARLYGVRNIIQASSSSVYGERTGGPFSEELKNDKPISLYAATKTAGEQICYTYSYLYEINIVCLRFFTVYGPRQRPDMAIHKMVKAIYEDKPIQMYGDGSTKRDYTYIDDIVHGIISSIDYDKTAYEVFNLGSSNPIELRYLITLIEKNINKKAIIEELPMQVGDVSITYADISKAQEIFGYQPKTSIEDGVKKFICWMKDMGTGNNF